jgi:glycosyltransferase involved in cell wall biosynthesis
MAASPKISVVIPVYNRADVIGRAVDSALNQTVKPEEVIVVDDGSTDNLTGILRKYGDRVQYISQDNKGPSAARNRGIKAAGGDYIAFLDSDDAWLPDKLEKQIRFIQSEKVSFVITDSEGFERTPQQQTTFQKSIFGENLMRDSVFVRDCFEMLVEQNFIHLSTVLVEKRSLEKSGMFDETMRIAEDTDLWLRLSLYYPVGIVRDVLALRDVRLDKLSGDQEKEFAGRISAFEKLLRSGELNTLQREKVAERKKWILGRLFYLYLHQREAKKGFRFLISSNPAYLFSKSFYRGLHGEYLEKKKMILKNKESSG